MRAARAIWIASVCVALAAGGAFAATAYVQVIDEAGTPIPGATVSASWFFRTFFPSRLKTGAGDYTCNKRGIAAIGLNGRALVTFNSAAKEGYVFENYLNPNREILSEKVDTRTNPRRIVLRRLEPVSFLLEVEGDGGRFSKGKPVEFGVDFFHKIRKEWKTPFYDDFFVSARYRENEHRWETVFWTTNANCGLVATVNRRFTAPETGYVSRVEVSQEAFTNEAFTLYLKTRNPTVYAMVPFGLSDLQSRGPVGQVKDPNWDFRYRIARINPYGGRELEWDERAATITGELHDEALQALLIEHRYPPRPDWEARLANRQKRHDLQVEINRCREVNKGLRESIKKEEIRLKGKNPAEIEIATRTLREKLKASGKRVHECFDELERLKNEAHTLNLPEEGEAAKGAGRDGPAAR
ncbi:MAG: hypothetical protein J6334_13455 [Kiritimatiellae bacterium]|nr:hypothetical protein [Kiritimatiellia bacterium]